MPPVGPVSRFRHKTVIMSETDSTIIVIVRERERERGGGGGERKRERERETDIDTWFIVKATDPYTKGGGG